MNFAKVNDVTIHYKLIGERKDRTFLFINSLGTDFRIWEDVSSALSVFGSCLLFDKRGHGLSDIASSTNGLKDYATDVIELLQHLSIEKCIPVGLSVGGMIAQQLSSMIPERIEKLVLSNTRHKIGDEKIWNDRIQAVNDKGLAAISEGVMQRWFPETFREENAIRVKGYRNMLERTPELGYIQTCEAIRDANLEMIAKAIKVPALCIAGSEDKSTTPDEVKNLADLISGSRFEVIKGSGHIPCVDNPQKHIELIIDFINDIHE